MFCYAMFCFCYHHLFLKLGKLILNIWDLVIFLYWFPICDYIKLWPDLFFNKTIVAFFCRCNQNWQCSHFFMILQKYVGVCVSQSCLMFDFKKLYGIWKYSKWMLDSWGCVRKSSKTRMSNRLWKCGKTWHIYMQFWPMHILLLKFCIVFYWIGWNCLSFTIKSKLIFVLTWIICIDIHSAKYALYDWIGAINALITI